MRGDRENKISYGQRRTNRKDTKDDAVSLFCVLLAYSNPCCQYPKREIATNGPCLSGEDQDNLSSLVTEEELKDFSSTLRTIRLLMLSY